ncbi:MAG: hypothetical protein AAFX54_06655 [Pseudomonadota bacterium]
MGGADQPSADGEKPKANADNDDRVSRLERTDRIALRISVAQTVLAVVGFFVGLVALYAALNEADAVRKQQQASVWPHLRIRDLNIGLSGEERFDIIVGNRGIGPAIIKNVRAVVDGKEMNSWYEIVDLAAGKESTAISHEPIVGAVVAPNEDITLVSLEAKYSSKEAVFAFRDLVRSGRATLIICYCSVFDDCRHVDAQANQTIDVKSCPAPDPTTEL